MCAARSLLFSAPLTHPHTPLAHRQRRAGAGWRGGLPTALQPRPPGCRAAAACGGARRAEPQGRRQQAASQGRVAGSGRGGGCRRHRAAAAPAACPPPPTTTVARLPLADDPLRPPPHPPFPCSRGGQGALPPPPPWRACVQRTPQVGGAAMHVRDGSLLPPACVRPGRGSTRHRPFASPPTQPPPTHPSPLCQLRPDARAAARHDVFHRTGWAGERAPALAPAPPALPAQAPRALPLPQPCCPPQLPPTGCCPRAERARL